MPRGANKRLRRERNVPRRDSDGLRPGLRMDIGVEPLAARRYRHRQVEQAAQRLARQQLGLGAVAEELAAAQHHDAADLGQYLFDMVGDEQHRRAAPRHPAQHVEEMVPRRGIERSEEHTSELQSLMRNSYAVFCLKQNNTTITRY